MPFVPWKAWRCPALWVAGGAGGQLSYWMSVWAVTIVVVSPSRDTVDDWNWNGLEAFRSAREGVVACVYIIYSQKHRGHRGIKHVCFECLISVVFYRKTVSQLSNRIICQVQSNKWCEVSGHGHILKLKTTWTIYRCTIELFKTALHIVLNMQHRRKPKSLIFWEATAFKPFSILSCGMLQIAGM